MTIATLLFDALILVHVVAGFFGLAAFWIPVCARKGGRVHVWAGRIYARCAYVVTLSAVVAAAGRVVSYRLQGIGVAERPELYAFAILLGYLGVATFAMVRQAMRVVATRRTPGELRTPAQEALGWASVSGSVIVVGFGLAAWSDVSPIMLGMSPIGLFTGWSMLRFHAGSGGRADGLVLQPPGFDAGERDRLPHRVHRLRCAAVMGLRDRGAARRPPLDPPDGGRDPRHRLLDPALPAEVRPLGGRRSLGASGRPASGPVRVHREADTAGMTSRRAGLGRTGVTAPEDFLELGEAVLAEHTETRGRSVSALPPARRAGEVGPGKGELRLLRPRVHLSGRTPARLT